MGKGLDNFLYKLNKPDIGTPIMMLFSVIVMSTYFFGMQTIIETALPYWFVYLALMLMFVARAICSYGEYREYKKKQAITP